MAFLSPHAPRQPIFRAPAVVLLLIAGLVALHAARSLATPEQSQDWIDRFAFIPAQVPALFQHGTAGLLPGLLPFVTYMGLHGGVAHLAINSLFLLAFGPIVARRFGAGLFLLFFVVCGVASALAYLAFAWGSPDPVIGASGGVSGLMAAGVRLLPTERPAWSSDTSPAEAAMLPIFSRQIILFTLVWAGVNILAGLTGLGMGGDVGQIAWQAHLGGFAAGLLLSGPFDALRPEPVGEQL